jgi:hypothetical protein
MKHPDSWLFIKSYRKEEKKMRKIQRNVKKLNYFVYAEKGNFYLLIALNN